MSWAFQAGEMRMYIDQRKCPPISNLRSGQRPRSRLLLLDSKERFRRRSRLRFEMGRGWNRVGHICTSSTLKSAGVYVDVAFRKGQNFTSPHREERIAAPVAQNAFVVASLPLAH